MSLSSVPIRRLLVIVAAGFLLLAVGLSAACSTSDAPTPHDLRLELDDWERMSVSDPPGLPRTQFWKKGLSSEDVESLGQTAMLVVVVREVDPEKSAEEVWEEVKGNSMWFTSPVVQLPSEVDYQLTEIEIETGNRALLAKATQSRYGSEAHIRALVTVGGGYAAVAGGVTPNAKIAEELTTAFYHAHAEDWSS